MTGADRYARSLRQALGLCIEAAHHAAPGETAPPPREPAAAGTG